MEEEKRSIRYLIAAGWEAKNNPKGKPSIKRISNHLGVNRNTVARNLNLYQTKGFLDANNRLTQLGERLVDDYMQYQERLVSWLVHHGIPEKTAQADAFEMLERCSDDVVSLLCRGGEMCKECDHYPAPSQASWFGISGRDVLRELKPSFPDGTYQLYFAIYKEQSHGSLMELSMANDGFEPYAEMMIAGEEGVILLKRRKMRQQSALGAWYSGALATLRYEEDACFHEAVIEDNMVKIPLSAFHIIYEEDCRTVRGMVRVLMTCSAGEMAMPESAGLLEFKLWKN